MEVPLCNTLVSRTRVMVADALSTISYQVGLPWIIFFQYHGCSIRFGSEEYCDNFKL